MVGRTQGTLVHEQRQRYITVVATGIVNPLMPLVSNACWGKGSDVHLVPTPKGLKGLKEFLRLALALSYPQQFR